MPPQFVIDDRTHVLVLTGAGVSAESGIPTFRGSNGLWENHPVEEVASPEGFHKNPMLVWKFYSERRLKAESCEPNPGHYAFVELEKKLGDRFLLATQNVDALHLKAGSQRVVEMHGNLYKTRCSVCDRPAFDDHTLYVNGDMPGCGRCDEKGNFALLRPHIVWFGEMLDPADLERIQAFMLRGAKERLVFVAAGTSGNVYPAAGLVDTVKRLKGESWLVNAEANANVSSYDHVVIGKSGEILPGLFGAA